jgi:HTH-type transcriptional regulator/antitoxin HipB
MIVRTPSDLGLLIRARRRELGLDQRTLAERVGVSRLWIIEFEKGKPRAEIGLVLRTLTALDLHLEVSTESVARAKRSGSSEHAASPPDIDAIVNAARKKGR